MADYGLIGGLAEGLKQGLMNYRDVKRYNDELNMKQTQQKAGLLEHGLEMDASGNPQLNPEEQAKRSYNTQMYATESASMDPNSPQSQHAVQSVRGLIKQIAPNSTPEEIVPEGTSQYEVQKNPILKPYVEAQAQLARTNAIMGMQGQRLEIMRGNQQFNQGKYAATGAVNDIHKDPTIMKANDSVNRANVDLNTFRNAQMITPQMLHELGTGFANLLSGGRGAGLQQSEMQTYSTAQSKLASLEQSITGKPYNALPPELRSFLDDSFSRLQEGWQKVAARRADQLYRPQPTGAAEQAHIDAIHQYDPDFQPSQGHRGGGLLSDQNQKATPSAGISPEDAIAELKKRGAIK